MPDFIVRPPFAFTATIERELGFPCRFSWRSVPLPSPIFLAARIRGEAMRADIVPNTGQCQVTFL